MNTQDLLTTAIVILPLAYATLLAVNFVTGLIKLVGKANQSTVPASVSRETLEEPVTAAVHIPKTPKFPAVQAMGEVHEFDRPIVGLLTAVPVKNPVITQKKPTRDELRQACSKNGIRWNRANGGKKHLSCEQMLAALEAIGVAV